MKTARVLLIGLLLAGSALAKDAWMQIELDDSAFKYYDTEEAYVHLVHAPGRLNVLLSSTPSSMKLSYDKIKQSTDSFGTKVAWDKQALLERVRIHDETFAWRYRDGLDIVHTKSNLDAVVAAYDAALAEIGFQRTEFARRPNARMVTYENGSDRFQVTFLRAGSETTVRMKEL